MSTRNAISSDEKKPNPYVNTRKTIRKQTSTANTTVASGTWPRDRLSSAHQLMIQLKANDVNSVPPYTFLFSRLPSPATNWPPAPNSRQNIAAVFRPEGVRLVPNAIGTRAAHPMARQMRPMGVGSAMGKLWLLCGSAACDIDPPGRFGREQRGA